VTAGRRWGALVVDVVAVVLFVVIGRASHRHGESVQGVASTAWPFALGLCAGWVALAALGRARGRSPKAPAGPSAGASAASGAVVCAATVAVGMTARVLAGQGTAPAFVGVATGFLGALMVGGRLALAAAERRGASRARRRTGPGGLTRAAQPNGSAPPPEP